MKITAILFGLCLVNLRPASAGPVVGTTATCIFSNPAHGKIIFTQQASSSVIEANFHMKNLPESSEFLAHVHEAPMQDNSGLCAGIGGHFDPLPNAGDITHETSLASNAAGRLNMRYDIKYLTLADDQTTGILGKSVAVHHADTKSKFDCCNIVRDE